MSYKTLDYIINLDNLKKSFIIARILNKSTDRDKL